MNRIVKTFKKAAALLGILALSLGIALTPVTVSYAKTGDSADKSEELRAAWIKYGDFKPSQYSNGSEFRAYVDTIFDNCKAMGMNAVFVHVRPFCDAMYESAYYPWSYYASGQQGKDPGFDPLEIMTEEAHERGLAIHAWLNPYRVTVPANGGTDVSKLAKSNPARKWLTNKKTSDDRNVLAYGGQLYLNPSKAAVRKLIVNGVKEIVENYDVDGIHFDDYFYPAFTPETYKEAFDAVEYNEYVKRQKARGKKYKNINNWRRANVNTLIKTIYSTVKESDPNVEFGISPGGYIDYLDEDFRWYVDYKTWMGNEGYIDYICPQLYWSFSTLNIYPFHEVLAKWEAVPRAEGVKLYLGLPVYKLNAGVNIDSQSAFRDSEWYDPLVLANMVRYGRYRGDVDGFILFDYEDMIASKNKTAMDFLTESWE